ncbi:DNA-binding response regulator, partial [Klebsiella oxytoca]
FSVYESGNGQEALSFLERADVDLMLADIMMPVLDGNRLTQMVKSKNADLPVIMLTSLSTIGDKKKSF